MSLPLPSSESIRRRCFPSTRRPSKSKELCIATSRPPAMSRSLMLTWEPMLTSMSTTISTKLVSYSGITLRIEVCLTQNSSTCHPEGDHSAYRCPPHGCNPWKGPWCSYRPRGHHFTYYRPQRILENEGGPQGGHARRQGAPTPVLWVASRLWRSRMHC